MLCHNSPVSGSIFPNTAVTTVIAARFRQPEVCMFFFSSAILVLKKFSSNLFKIYLHHSLLFNVATWPLCWLRLKWIIDYCCKSVLHRYLYDFVSYTSKAYLFIGRTCNQKSFLNQKRVRGSHLAKNNILPLIIQDSNIQIQLCSCNFNLFVNWSLFAYKGTFLDVWIK